MSVDAHDRRRDSLQEAENTADSIHVSNSETDDGSEQTRTTEQARQGHTGDHVRYILMASVAGAVFAMAILIAYFLI